MFSSHFFTDPLNLRCVNSSGIFPDGGVIPMCLLSVRHRHIRWTVTVHFIVCLPARVLIPPPPLSGAPTLALRILGFLSPSCTFSPSLSDLKILVCSCFTRFACYKRTEWAPMSCTTRELLCGEHGRRLPAVQVPGHSCPVVPRSVSSAFHLSSLPCLFLCCLHSHHHFPSLSGL